jgi:5-methylcytosine-specific restriction protein A
MTRAPRLRNLQSRIAIIDTQTAKPAPKVADALYSTPEYRAWRNKVITRALGRCQWPGCTRAEPRMFADHIIEVKDGGAPYDPTNGQCLCGRHHSLKTARVRAARQRS